MPTTAHGAPYPSPEDARNVPGDLKALAEWVDAHTTLTAVDSGDRDAKYADLQPGQLVTTSEPPLFMWIKAGVGNTWLTVYNDTGWVETGFIPAANFEKGGYLRVSRVNGWVELLGEMTYTGSDPIVAAGPDASAPGNISDTALVTVPPAFAPGGVAGPVVVAWRSYLSGGMGALSTAGNVYLTDMHTSSMISNGDFVRFSAVYRQA